MKIEEFRIVQKKFNYYIIERKFEKYKYAYLKWYNFYPKKIKVLEWSPITSEGDEITIRNHWNALKPFHTKEEAISFIKGLCGNSNYYYPPFK